MTARLLLCLLLSTIAADSGRVTRFDSAERTVLLEWQIFSLVQPQHMLRLPSQVPVGVPSI